MSVDERIGEEALRLLDNRASMNARNSEGGTASERVQEMVEAMEGWLKQ